MRKTGYEKGREDEADIRAGSSLGYLVVAAVVAVALIWVGQHVYAGCTDFFGFFKTCSMTVVK